MVKIVFRKARLKDLASINVLTDRMHNYLAGLYGLKPSEEELEEEHYDEDELEETLVAEDSEKGIVVGYLSFSLSRNEWAGPHFELEHLVVREDYEGLGIASKLLRLLEQKAKNKKVNITTGTLVKNKTALKFYKKLGFKPLTVTLLLDVQKRTRQ
jgi:ribosomal protein S18 acetylase RimI-like enzyme